MRYHRNKLTQKQLKKELLYNKDFGIFRWRKNRCNNSIIAGDIAGSNDSGYIRMRINYKRYFGHQLAWLYEYGYFPRKQIDHINRNRGDNRICNLREVSYVENNRNQPISSKNTSGVVGVCWIKKIKKWRAMISSDNGRKLLGYYSELEEAKKVIEQARVKYGYHPNHGKNLNKQNALA